MTILCLGLSHHTAPVKLRERLSFGHDALRAALSRFGCGWDTHPASISELIILSTCNRLELYASVQPTTPSAAPATTEPLRALLDFLVETRGVAANEFERHLYHQFDTEAVRHICRVAAGLDSMVLGEPQILGQVTEAYEAALSQRATGPILSALFRTAIRAGKRARSETAISRNPASISSVAIRLAESVVGDLRSHHVLVIGAGQMGELAVEALRARGAWQIAVVNRTQQRAAELAQRWGGLAFGLEQLTEAIRVADIVIASTGAPHTIIGPALVQAVINRRTNRPLVFIDIAVPRDVDPAVKQIPHVHLFDMDDLQSHLGGSIADRRNEIPRVEAIVEQEVAAFVSRLHEIEVMPVIAELRKRAESIRQREVDRTLHDLPDLDPQTRERIQQLSRSLVNKLLHQPTLGLRAEAHNGRAAEYVETVRYLFGLTADAAPPIHRESQF